MTETLASLFESEIERRGLQVALQLIRESEEIGEEHLPRLASAPLPVLVRLVEEAFSASNLGYPPKPTIRPVTILRIASRLEAGQSPEKISAQIREHVLSRIEENQAFLPLSIACDRWSEWSALPVELEILRKLISDSALTRTLHLIGPSSAEIQALTATASVEAIFQLFESYGILSIDGGSHIDVHEVAARKKFSVTYGQDLSDLIESSVVNHTISNRTLRPLTSPLEERLCLELLVLKRRVGALGRLRVWFPWFRSAVSRFSNIGDQALGIPILRAIALARILLPQEVRIRAPISALGKHLGELSMLCGADDFGYAAVDRETATALGISLMSEVQPLLGRGLL